jgi:ATP-dependent DNA helicase RecG
MKTACAFLNGQGGKVLFGVNDKGKISGQSVSSKTLEDIARELKRLDPAVSPSIDVVELDNGQAVIAVTVEPGEGPYTFDGRPYERVGASTNIMPRAVYEKLLFERLHPARRWENQPVPDNITINDLDAEEIETLIANAVSIGRMETPRRMDIESILVGLELIQDGHLLNAAVVLFGKNVGSQFPQCEIRLARFRGIDKQPDFIDNRQYKDHAFGLLRRAEAFLLDHVPIAGELSADSMIRRDTPCYPPRATREALANAICHRDYTIAGGAVAVAMFDNRLEIISPGEFHFGLTADEMLLSHDSRPWNPLIANTFYRAGVIERWGSGTTNMVHWCKENGNPVPGWEERNDSVVVSFYPPADQKKESQKIITPQATPQATPQVEKLLRCCHEPLSREELQQELKIHDRKYFRETFLRPALISGFIELTIPDKPNSPLQKYRITEEGRTFLGQKDAADK